MDIISGTGLTCFRMGRTHTGFESEILSSLGLLQKIPVKSGMIYKGVRWAGCYSGPELWAELLETDWIQQQEVEVLIHCVDSGRAESRSQGEETNVISV